MDTDFDPGPIFVTGGIQASDISVEGIYLRHCLGDWGDLSADDKRLNDEAAAERPLQGRILSAYHIEGQKVYIITEPTEVPRENRTTIMLADEY